MKNAEKALTERIRELRRRHFGPRGKAEFARRLGIPEEEYARYERGTLPPGETLIRICEATGEDLQWLLTGVAARGTVVISQARTRHQELLARLACLLDQDPTLAAPIESFVDLLAQGRQAEGRVAAMLPAPPTDALIPIFEAHELPARIDGLDGPEPAGGFPLVLTTRALAGAVRAAARVVEPAAQYHDGDFRPVELVTLAPEAGQPRLCLHSVELAQCFPRMFGVRLRDRSMEPMFQEGDIALVTPGSKPQVGCPAVSRLVEPGAARCRIWLGEDEDGVRLGRLADGEAEHLRRGNVCWSLNVLYRLAAA
ncbi:MAG: helix-turn-helix domain-containing protein [Phycisphaerae bacterium]